MSTKDRIPQNNISQSEFSIRKSENELEIKSVLVRLKDGMVEM